MKEIGITISFLISGLFGAELVYMMVADPYLFLLPSVAYARLGRGISNSSGSL